MDTNLTIVRRTREGHRAAALIANDIARNREGEQSDGKTLRLVMMDSRKDVNGKDYLAVVKFAMLLIAVCAAMLVDMPSARSHDETSHAKLDPNERDWFGEQKIPSGANQGNSCCSQADGEFAEEEIRDGHYWARWPRSNGVWYRVPDEAVIKNPNPHGRAAVWWGGQEENKTIYIRCFIAGALF